MCNSLLIALAAAFSWSALAIEPLHLIDPRDAEHSYFVDYVRLDHKTIAPNQWRIYADIDHFGLGGRVVPIEDGQAPNFLNLVFAVNGGVYYVDALLSDISSFKIRRRWEAFPEPGIFVRVEGTRFNPRIRADLPVQMWIKIATPEGFALPVFRTFEGNYDL